MWKSIQPKAALARGLSSADWLFLAEAWWVLLGFFLALRRHSLESLNKSFRLKSGEKIDPAAAQVLAHRLQRLVSLAARLHLLSMTCLVRACSLQWMLGRRGIPSRLCIGVNKNLSGMQAHAWVQVMGQAVGEAEDIEDRFTVLEPATSSLISKRP